MLSGAFTPRSVQRGRSLWLGLVAVLAVAACGGGGGSASNAPAAGSPSPAGAGAPATSPSPSSSPASIQAFIPIAEHYVEQHRGLRFKHAVTVTFLSDAAFKARLLKDQPLDKAAVTIAAKELRAMGLIPAGIDLGKIFQELLSQAVEGFYDPKTKDLVVRGVAATPYVREVLVHELTHALQDQWFSIEHPELVDDTVDERPLAYHALVEGDAVRIQQGYRAAESIADQLQAGQEEGAAAGAIATDTPLVLLESLSFPYTAGPPFVAALLRQGQSRLDAAFASPPVDSAQILHPERFLAGAVPVAVAQPAADGTAFDHGILGEFSLQLLLQDAANRGQITSGEGDLTRSAWGGDAYVAWDTASGSCLRTTLVADTPGDSVVLVKGLVDLAAHRPGVSVRGSGPVVLTTCG